jgi:hypothetical protein
MSRVRALVASIVVVVAVGSVLLIPAAPAGTQAPRRVLVYGDSLTWEAVAGIEHAIEGQLPGWEAVVRTFPGLATCDELPQMRADGNMNAGVVVLEFVAVPFGPCMAGKDSLAQHTADTKTALDLWGSRGVPVVLVGAPRGLGEPRDQNGAGAINRDLAAGAGQTFVDSGVLLRDPWTGVYQQRLPCLAGETAEQGCDGGLIDVRQEGHFCHVPNTSPCPVYSSGIVRFAAAIAAAAARAAGSTPKPLPAPPPAPEIQDAVRVAFSGSGTTDAVATASLLAPEAIPADFAAEPPTAPATTAASALTARTCRAIRQALKTTKTAALAETAYSAPVTGARVDQIVHVMKDTSDAQALFGAYAAPKALKCLAGVFGVVGVIGEPTAVGDGAVTYRLGGARQLVIQLVRTGRAVTALAYANVVTPPPDDVVNAVTNAAVTRTEAALAASPAR